jgi:hypothetical protein
MILIRSNNSYYYQCVLICILFSHLIILFYFVMYTLWIVSRRDGFTISDISKAIYELDFVKFAKASFDQLPYEAVALPLSAVSVLYMRLYSPWRHEKWPYSEEQAKWRTNMGIRLSPPYYPTRIFVPLMAAAWAMDKFRKVFTQKSE